MNHNHWFFPYASFTQLNARKNVITLVGLPMKVKKKNCNSLRSALFLQPGQSLSILTDNEIVLVLCQDFTPPP